jgi:hypothetical protein
MTRALALALLAIRSAAAHADTPIVRPEGIEVDRDTTPPGQAELSFDGGAPIGTWALGVTLGYIARPIRFHTFTPSQRARFRSMTARPRRSAVRWRSAIT